MHSCTVGLWSCRTNSPHSLDVPTMDPSLRVALTSQVYHSARVDSYSLALSVALTSGNHFVFPSLTIVTHTLMTEGSLYHTNLTNTYTSPQLVVWLLVLMKQRLVRTSSYSVDWLVRSLTPAITR